MAVKEPAQPQLDAQIAVIGSALIEPEITGELLQTVTASDFTDPTYRNVFEAVKGLYIERKRIDAVTVLHVLGNEYRDFLGQTMDLTPTAAGWKEYAKIMKQQAKLSRLQSLAVQLQMCATLEEANELVPKITDEMRDRSKRIVSIGDGFRLFLDAQSRDPDYITFGIDDLDSRTYAARGDFIVIGARPSVGKTALAIQMARHVGGNGFKVGFFSLETKAEKFYDRYVSNATGTSFSRIKRRELDENDYEPINAEMRREIKGVNLEMIDASGMTVNDIRATTLARRYDVIFVDYLQLIAGTERDTYNRVTQISMGLHNLAQQANVCVVALAQLRRAEKAVDKKTKQTIEYAPTMSDLRESGQIEQDADIVLLMYLEKPEVRNSPRVLRVAKNKEGQCGKIRLQFDGLHQRFDAEPEELPPPIGSAAPQRTPTEKVKQMALFGMPSAHPN